MASLHQSKFSSWFSAQRLPIWAAYALGGVTVAFHSILSPELLIILLCSLAIAGLLAIDKHKKNMPKPIRQIASLAILTAFSWCSIVLSYPAHALVFSRISAGLSHAISGEGTSASDITAWVAKFLSILVFVAICGLIVGWFRRGRENEEESKRAS